MQGYSFTSTQCLVLHNCENESRSRPYDVHDKSAGGYQETRPPPAYGYHSGTLLEILFRCARFPRRIHDDGNGPCQASAHMDHFPIGSIKLIQQIVLTETNVCSHAKQGCVLESVDHLGVYGFILPNQSIPCMVATASQNTAWVVEQVRVLDVISVCNMRTYMNYFYTESIAPATKVSSFDPEIQFRYLASAHGATQYFDLDDDHQDMAPNQISKAAVAAHDAVPQFGVAASSNTAGEIEKE
eukprot:6491684-Amphidinium_carterae.8